MFSKILEVFGFVGKIAEARKELRLAQIESRTAITRQRVDSETAWESMAAENARTSWLDEFWSLVLAVPLIMCFVPHLQDYALQGFETLEKTPEFYKWAIGAAIGWAFARKKWPSLTSWRRPN